jgi:hypothetical protein
VRQDNGGIGQATAKLDPFAAPSLGPIVVIGKCETKPTKGFVLTLTIFVGQELKVEDAVVLAQSIPDAPRQESRMHHRRCMTSRLPGRTEPVNQS